MLLLLLDSAEGQHSQQQHNTPASKAWHVTRLMLVFAERNLDISES